MRMALASGMLDAIKSLEDPLPPYINEATLCDKCAVGARKAYEEGRKAIWAALPQLFGMKKSWEELRAEYETVPMGPASNLTWSQFVKVSFVLNIGMRVSLTLYVFVDHTRSGLLV